MGSIQIKILSKIVKAVSSDLTVLFCNYLIGPTARQITARRRQLTTTRTGVLFDK